MKRPDLIILRMGEWDEKQCTGPENIVNESEKIFSNLKKNGK